MRFVVVDTLKMQMAAIDIIEQSNNSIAGMKICLIRPPAVESFRFSTGSVTPPLGFAYIIAALEHAGREVDFIDAVALGPKTFTSY